MSESSIPIMPAAADMLLVTDELASPADFALYRALGAHLKTSGKTGGKAIILSATPSLQKWKAIMAKMVCRTHSGNYVSFADSGESSSRMSMWDPWLAQAHSSLLTYPNRTSPHSTMRRRHR